MILDGYGMPAAAPDQGSLHYDAVRPHPYGPTLGRQYGPEQDSRPRPDVNITAHDGRGGDVRTGVDGGSPPPVL